MQQLDLHCQMILEEYLQSRSSFEIMKNIVRAQLEKCVHDNGLYVTAIETRVKAEDSLAGKLALKGYKYQSLSDITDILGARVITFYTDEVDKIAALVDKIFEVDWKNSVDKRKMLELNQFGYMSLHYVCRIPESLYHDEAHPEINQYRFEIQLRTALQHVWATMNHDIGYKSGIEIPREHLRNLNRIAGMLELADEQFSRIRKEVADYRRHIQSLVADGNFDAVPLDGDSFRSYLALNPFKKLIEKIATINQAEVYEDNLLRYLDVLQQMGFKTLGDIERLRKECSERAYQLAVHQLAATDLDIVALSVALQNLCIIYILQQRGGVLGLRLFFDTLFGVSESNAERAERTAAAVDSFNIV
ncbi:MAG: hypothetical protein MJZ49_04310 [Bacteroidales bacterium]|nr:hypothetical protein [Bacteroidales bacterium]